MGHVDRNLIDRDATKYGKRAERVSMDRPTSNGQRAAGCTAGSTAQPIEVVTERDDAKPRAGQRVKLTRPKRRGDCRAPTDMVKRTRIGGKRTPAVSMASAPEQCIGTSKQDLGNHTEVLDMESAAPTALVGAAFAMATATASTTNARENPMRVFADTNDVQTYGTKKMADLLDEAMRHERMVTLFEQGHTAREIGREMGIVPISKRDCIERAKAARAARKAYEDMVLALADIDPEYAAHVESGQPIKATVQRINDMDNEAIATLRKTK